MPSFPPDDNVVTSTQFDNVMGNLAVSTKPIMICSVLRRINIGNYEHIDVYAGVALPMDSVDSTDFEALQSVVEKTSEVGFALTSSETNKRYEFIKNLQNEGK